MIIGKKKWLTHVKVIIYYLQLTSLINYKIKCICKIIISPTPSKRLWSIVQLCLSN